MHQSIDVILSQLYYGKISFIVLVPEVGSDHREIYLYIVNCIEKTKQ